MVKPKVYLENRNHIAKQVKVMRDFDCATGALANHQIAVGVYTFWIVYGHLNPTVACCADIYKNECYSKFVKQTLRHGRMSEKKAKYLFLCVT